MIRYEIKDDILIFFSIFFFFLKKEKKRGKSWESVFERIRVY